ncbi:MAG: hypothetical protein WBW75_10610 [Mycobacterium sp.]|uniref:hypothetical protein n=1 Tax=Mycobacterium sp. TaxID=1785 RepID=UPI003C67B3FF
MTFGRVQAPAPVQQQQPQGNQNQNPVAVPAGPSINVTPDQGNQKITFTVQNTSAPPRDLKCTYNAKKLSGQIGPPTTTKDFTLKAGASTTLKFMEIPIGTTYQVDISCTGQNGGAGYSHNFSG